MYFGLALPPGRTAMPTQPISIFLRLEDVHYGEVSAPLWPGRSVQSANPGLAATHTFLVTNPGLQAADFEFAVLGTGWAGSVQPDRATLGPGEARQLSAQVTVDPEATAGTSDAGFLRVRAVGDEPWEAAAEMVTYTGESPAPDRLKLTWEYWGDRGWSTLAVNDETANLTRSGLLEFLPPPDMAPHTEFGWTGYWLRVGWTQGVYAHEPRLRRVLPNTTHGLQTVTFTDEILGSSDAGKTSATGPPAHPSWRASSSS